MPKILQPEPPRTTAARPGLAEVRTGLPVWMLRHLWVAVAVEQRRFDPANARIRVDG